MKQFYAAVRQSKMPRYANQMWQCPVCSVSYTTRQEVRNHIRNYHSKSEKHGVNLKKLPRNCPVCHLVFSTYRSLSKHMHDAKHYGQYKVPCNYCHQRFIDETEQADHMNTMHFAYFEVIQSAFEGKLQVIGRSYADGQVLHPDHLYTSERAKVENLLNAFLFRFNSVRVYCVAYGRFIQYTEDGELDRKVTIPLRTSSKTLFSSAPNVARVWKDLTEELNVRVDALTLQGSGYSLYDLGGVELHMARIDYAGGRGGGGDGGAINGRLCEKDLYFESHFTARERRALLDVESSERHGCFFTAVAAGFYYANQEEEEEGEDAADGGEITLKEWCAAFADHYMTTNGFERPMPVKSIEKFENKNRESLDVAVNVYMKGNYAEHGQFAGSAGKKRKWSRSGLGKYFFFPVYASKRRKTAGKIVNLLLYRKGEEMHYALITDLARLLGTHNQQKVCPNCLQTVGVGKYNSHERVCFSNEAQTIVMPKLDSEGRPPKMKIRIGSKRFKSPIVGFCDFEAANRFEEKGIEEAEELAGHVSGTAILADQPPIAYTMLFVATEDNIPLFEASYSSDDSVDLMRRFFADLDSCKEKVMPLLNDMADIKPVLTEQEARRYFLSPCWICRKPITQDDEDDGDDRVLDHAHSSLSKGRFLGPAHRSCNSSRQHQRQIPIFVHNLQNYDGHFLLAALRDRQISSSYQVYGLADNTQKFKTITFNEFKFLDSLHFLTASLDKLVKDLKSDTHQFSLLRRHFTYKTLAGSRDLNLLTRKGVFAYEDVTSVAKLRSQTALPAADAFYSRITNSNVSPEDYEHALNVYDRAGCSNMEEYMMLYCKLDVYLLAEVVLNFQNTVYEECELDMSQYISMPHLSFDIMLQDLEADGTEVELVTDPEIHQMCESGLRGGVCQVSMRHVTVDPPVDKDKPPTLLYTDVVNLYGKCMMDYLPVGKYEWLSPDEIETIDWTALQDDRDYGYICEVDLEYPPEKHFEHNSFPLAPHRLEINYQMLSEHSKEYLANVRQSEGKGKRQTGKRTYKSTKLVPTLHDRKYYVCHYRALKLYLKHGMKLKKVHRVVKFRQKQFLRAYVERMTEKRKKATSSFGKALYKLAINSIYGKLVQNVRDQTEVVFVQDERHLARQLRNPAFSTFRILNENCAVFFMKKRLVRMNKPYICGFTVVDLAKEHMYKVFYDDIRPKVPDAELVFTDTDSLLLYSQNVSKNDFLDKCAEIFDFSNYPKDDPRYDESHAMVPGYIKDENGGKNLIEVIALKAKCYALKIDDGEIAKRCKGVPRRVLKSDISLDDYRETLHSLNHPLRANIVKLQAKNHTIQLLHTRKAAMTTMDDKRYVFRQCGIHTMSYGHVYLREGNTDCPFCQQ